MFHNKNENATLQTMFTFLSLQRFDEKRTSNQQPATNNAEGAKKSVSFYENRQRDGQNAECLNLNGMKYFVEYMDYGVQMEWYGFHIAVFICEALKINNLFQRLSRLPSFDQTSKSHYCGSRSESSLSFCLWTFFCSLWFVRLETFFWTLGGW